MNGSELAQSIARWLRSNGPATARTIAKELKAEKSDVNSQLYKHQLSLFSRLQSNLWTAPDKPVVTKPKIVKIKLISELRKPHPWRPKATKKSPRPPKTLKKPIVTEAWLERQSTHPCPRCRTLIDIDAVKCANCFTYGFDSLEGEVANSDSLNDESSFTKMIIEDVLGPLPDGNSAGEMDFYEDALHSEDISEVEGDEVG